MIIFLHRKFWKVIFSLRILLFSNISKQLLCRLYNTQFDTHQIDIFYRSNEDFVTDYIHLISFEISPLWKERRRDVSVLFGLVFVRFVEINNLMHREGERVLDMKMGGLKKPLVTKKLVENVGKKWNFRKKCNFLKLRLKEIVSFFKLREKIK